MMHNQTSKISRRARPVPIERGELYGSIYDSMTSRVTEVDAGLRIAYGEQILATNAAGLLYDPEAIKCCNCGHRKHYNEFDRCATYPWRFGRAYECKICRKRSRMMSVDAQDEAYLRSKPNGRRKRT